MRGKVWDEIIINYQTSTIAPLKLKNGYLISSLTL